MTAKRCPSRYSLQVRCEDAAGHDGPHGHSFYARYWADADRPTATASAVTLSPFTRRALAGQLPAKVVR